MSKVRITKRLVDGLEVRPGEYVIWDTELTGFGVRVRPTGNMTYIVQYRAGSGRGAPTKKLTLGPVGKLTPDEARTAAKSAIGDVLHGGDPARDKTAKRTAPTIDELASDYITDFVAKHRKPMTLAAYQHYLPFVVSAWAGRKAVDITRADVAKLHREVGAKTPVLANRIVTFLSGVYSWADDQERVAEGCNPTRKIKKFPEQGKERYLNAEEYQRLGDALEAAEQGIVSWEPDPDRKVKHAPKDGNRTVEFSPYVIAAIRLFLFTGARLREILHMRWEEYDADRGVIFHGDTKTGRQTLVLSDAAKAIIDAIPRGGDYIIAGRDPTKPRADIKRPWGRLRAYAGMEDVRLHDLRHSFASVGVGGGYGLPIVGKLLGHTQAATTQKYAHLDTEPVRRVTNEIGRRINNAMAGGAAAKPFAHGGETNATAAKGKPPREPRRRTPATKAGNDPPPTN